MRHNIEVNEILKALKEELDYKTFLEMKQQWLNNVRIEWLVAGHITDKDALQIVNDCERSFKFRKITADEIPEQRLIKLPTNYVAEYEELNEDPENPNSAIFTLFQHNLKTQEDQAANSIVFQLLKEPFFNQLRTQQQLGYIV